MAAVIPFSEGPSAEKTAVRVRVIGCGNALAADDSVGMEAVTRLGEKWNSPSCRFTTVSQPGPELLDLFLDIEVVLLVDAVLSDAAPGTVHLIPLPCPNLEVRPLSAISTHGWGLGETLELAASLGQHLPRTMLLGIELGSVEPGALRSQATEESMMRILQGFPQLLRQLADPGGDVWRRQWRFPPGDVSFLGGGLCA